MIDYIPRGFSARKGYLHARRIKGSGISPVEDRGVEKPGKENYHSGRKRSFEYLNTLNYYLAKFFLR